MLIVVHFSHLMYLDLNSELRSFERGWCTLRNAEI